MKWNQDTFIKVFTLIGLTLTAIQIWISWDPLEAYLSCMWLFTAAIYVLSWEDGKEAKRGLSGAYSERAQLVAALAHHYPASLERPSDAESGFDWIIYLDLPAGQASWHIANYDLVWFDHVPREQGRVWDGHSTYQKYKRLTVLSSPSEE